MDRVCIITTAILAVTLVVPAQVVVSRPMAAASVEGTVTVDTYRDKVREGYVSVGVPTEVVEKVLPLDVDIYNARVAGDLPKVQTLRKQQEVILTPTYTTKVRTYYIEHPYKVNIGSSVFPVWIDETPVGVTKPSVVSMSAEGDVIEVPTYEQRLREAYVAIGMPENIIASLVPLDVDIYKAYAAGNTVDLVDLQARRARILTATQRANVVAYFRTNPMTIRTRGKTFTVWESADGNVVKTGEVVRP